jgi:uncharacterized protein with NRDE domain
MCLAAIAIGQSARFPWVLLSNRDEFFDRPAEGLGWWHPWPDGPCILSGRDRFAGGTWLGLNEAGHLALVTNVREPGRVLINAPSRGGLVLQWLLGDRDDDALQALLGVPRNGFNLLTADLLADPSAGASAGASASLPRQAAAAWLSNRSPNGQQALRTGVYGLSNAAIDTPWPKVLNIKSRLQAALRHTDKLPDLVAAGFAALGDRRPAPDALLPQTGVSLERERQLSSAFINTTLVGGASSADSEGSAARAYGTRCATIVVAETRADRRLVHIIERSFDAHGAVSGEVSHQVEAGTGRRPAEVRPQTAPELAWPLQPALAHLPR